MTCLFKSERICQKDFLCSYIVSSFSFRYEKKIGCKKQSGISIRTYKGYEDFLYKQKIFQNWQCFDGG